MALTESESALARTLLRRMETSARSWTFFRWVALTAGAACLVLAAFNYQTMMNPTFAETAVNDVRPANTADVRAEVDKMNEYLMLAGRFGVELFAGVLLVVMSISRWNRRRRDELIVKIIREHLAEKHGLEA